MKTHALTGVRIIDLTMGWAGPFVTMLLGDLGAEIIKVEAIQHPDWWRGSTTDIEAALRLERPWEKGASFNGVNRNKKGITLNLQSQEGLEALRKLVRISDVVIENYTPRVMSNLGLDYVRLCEIKPDIIMVSISGYGSDGPWCNFPAFASPVEDMSGFPRITGFEDDQRPRRWGNAGADALAGVTAAFALLAALEQHRRTGVGQRIDVSMVEVLTSFLAQSILEGQAFGRQPKRLGNNHPNHAPHNIYPCAGEDKWVAVAVTSDKEWQSLCGLLGQSSWSTDPRFKTESERRLRRELLDSTVAEWTRARSRHEVMHLCQAADVPAMPVFASPELIEDEHIKARSYFEWAEKSEIGKHVHGLLWAHFDKTPITLESTAPTLGEHTEEILRELLCMSEETLSELRDKLVIGDMPDYWYQAKA